MAVAITKMYQVTYEQLNTVADLDKVIDVVLNANFNLDFNAFTEPAVDEVQSITLTGTDSGTWTWTANGQTTAAIPWNASTGAVQTALENLSSVNPGDVIVGGGPGNWILTFGGALAGVNIPNPTVNGSSLVGTSPQITTSTSMQGKPARRLYSLLISRNGQNAIQPLNQSAPPFGRYLVWDTGRLLDLSTAEFNAHYTIV